MENWLWLPLAGGAIFLFCYLLYRNAQKETKRRKAELKAKEQQARWLLEEVRRTLKSSAWLARQKLREAERLIAEINDNNDLQAQCRSLSHQISIAEEEERAKEAQRLRAEHARRQQEQQLFEQKKREQEELARQQAEAEKKRRQEEDRRKDVLRFRAKIEKLAKERQQQQQAQQQAKDDSDIRYCATDMVVSGDEEEQQSTQPQRKTNWQQYLALLQANGIQYLYHFTDRRNLASIKQHGGLYSWHYCEEHHIEIPNQGGNDFSRNLDRQYGLQDYVRLSFCIDHPMAYRLKQNGADIVILKISTEVALLDGTLYSDINATDSAHTHGGNLEHLQRINFNAVKRTYVSREDPDFKPHQAEVMVKTFVPLKYILNI